MVGVCAPNTCTIYEQYNHGQPNCLQLYMLEVMVNLRRRYELQFENIGNLMENITSSIIHLLTTTTTVGEHGVYVYIYLSHCNYKKKINKELSLQGKKKEMRHILPTQPLNLCFLFSMNIIHPESFLTLVTHYSLGPESFLNTSILFCTQI